MRVEYLDRMERIARRAGTREPDDLMEAMGCVFMDPGNCVGGFVSRRKGTTYYGVNQGITGRKYDFCVMHEGFHVVCRHLDVPGFLSGTAPSHVDRECSFADRRAVAGTEREANIGAADFIIDTRTILEMLGYDSADAAAYRNSVESFDQAVRDYRRHFDIVVRLGSPEGRIRRMQTYEERLTGMYRELQEQARDIENTGIHLSKYAIAREFGVPEYIIDYKLEALELRNYSIAAVELPPFEKVFRGWG